MVTRRTEPGRIRAGCLCENMVAKSFCFSGVGKVLCKWAIIPFPLHNGSGGDS
jgi:hypothetical protein